MLVVRLEIWPGGHEARRRVLGTILIANDGTGNHMMGNYRYDVQGQTGSLKAGEGEIGGYQRQRHHPWKLVWTVLDKVFKERERGRKTDS